MATLVLSAAGAALGGSVGGTIAGLSSMIVGKAVGATLGSVIDQRILGLGSAPVESGRVERFRVMGSSEGAGLARVFGRFRVSGQLIWSSRFLEHVDEDEVGGGKGGGGQTVRNYSYSVSIAVALCEGEVIRLGRIWADGQPIEQVGLNLRLHSGSDEQLPDPLIEAIEGSEHAPAYRGTAYVVIEDLDLSRFGNRIPQLAFEVFRRPDVGAIETARHPALDIRGVALVPGTGEYSLATEPVFRNRGKGNAEVLNIHNDLGQPDLEASLDQLDAELPRTKAVSLVVSWFGDDLRCDRCTLRPKVEQSSDDGSPMRWEVSNRTRGDAATVSWLDGRPVFGGTPADASVIQAIETMKERGLDVMFYPFILMDILPGNGLNNPWTGETDQPPVPWRGRITLSKAAGRPGSTDKTPAAATEVSEFFGEARADDFEYDGKTIRYTGPSEWSYRRFILHYAHLCVRAGGVEAFCIGSELRGLTQIRDGADSYPVVAELCRLADDVRSILGSATRIGYAADWSEYFGHHPDDGSGDLLYHLDPLWAHPNIDFVGIDNYMPVSDWRDAPGHADAAAGSLYNLDYLKSNVAGGEGFEWYYADAAGREAQVRLPISDGAYGEDWVYRYKDLVNWWGRPHENRIGGIKVGAPTDWSPKSKPIWFTELGCPAVDKGTNQPNVFHDPKSSESFYPYFSDGSRDDYIQRQYLRASLDYWSDDQNNPPSQVYSGRMVDMAHAYVWAWDARPWPEFPNRMDTWIDGANYHRGHWMNGRAALPSLSEVVAELCGRAELTDIDVDELHGTVIGYAAAGVESARQSLQPLMLACAFDGHSADGKVVFSRRGGSMGSDLDRGQCVDDGKRPVISLTRAPAAETAGRVTFSYLKSDADYEVGAAESIAADASEPGTAQTSLPIVMSDSEANETSRRLLSENRVARDAASFTLPPSALSLSPCDVVSLQLGGHVDHYRIDRTDETSERSVHAVRIEPDLYRSAARPVAATAYKALSAPAPIHVELLDLPLRSGDDARHAPWIAVTGSPWRGPAAVYSADEDHGYSFEREIRRSAVVGEILDPLHAANPGRWMRQSLRVRIASGKLQSRSEVEVLNGANVAAVGHGGVWEIVQFCAASLVAPGEYWIEKLLRGQAGTDCVMPVTWQPGTDFVLLDRSVVQLNLPRVARGVERHFRVGPATRSFEDPSFTHLVGTFEGVSLRPYRPVHLRLQERPDGALVITWIRRTRVNGDDWAGVDVPLGEGRESYHVRILSGTVQLREFFPDTARQTYSAADREADGFPLNLSFEVAQLSERFGPGPYERITLDG